MKAEITGYITALINSYERNISKLYSINVNNSEIKKYENFRNELIDLLDFVEDIPEETAPIVTIINNGEVDLLIKRIKELEETCIANNEIIANQFRKMQAHKGSKEHGESLRTWRERNE